MLTRRLLLQHAGAGFGALALQALLARDGLLAAKFVTNLKIILSFINPYTIKKKLQI